MEYLLKFSKIKIKLEKEQKHEKVEYKKYFLSNNV